MNSLFFVSEWRSYTYQLFTVLLLNLYKIGKKAEKFSTVGIKCRFSMSKKPLRLTSQLYFRGEEIKLRDALNKFTTYRKSTFFWQWYTFQRCKLVLETFEKLTLITKITLFSFNILGIILFGKFFLLLTVKRKQKF